MDGSFSTLMTSTGFVLLACGSAIPVSGQIGVGVGVGVGEEDSLELAEFDPPDEQPVTTSETATSPTAKRRENTQTPLNL
jgi:hypothetical protein